MSDLKSKNKEVVVGKKYFIKVGGAAYENNQGQVRKVAALIPRGCWKYEVQNIENGAETHHQDCVDFEDLISLKDFKYQVGDEIKVKKSYTSTCDKDGSELAGTKQTILCIDEFDTTLPVLITAPEGYSGSCREPANNYWVSYKDIKIVSRPLK